jgi:hypothetical protein
MAEEIFVQRGNKRLRVKKQYAQDYVAAGYNIVTNGGKVIQQAIPTDVDVLRKAYVEQVSEIAALKKELQELKSSSKSARKKRDIE